MTYFKNKNVKRKHKKQKKKNKIPINLLPALSFQCNYIWQYLSATAA